MKKADQISHISPVLPVKDMQRSLRFYTEVLGFRTEFTWKEPVEYAVLKTPSEASVHLSLSKNTAGSSILYVFCKDVHAFFASVKSLLPEDVQPPSSYDYGMTEFECRDPDGHLLIFATGS